MAIVLVAWALLAPPIHAEDGATKPDATASPRAEETVERMKVKISFGHKTTEKTTFPLQWLAGSTNLTVEAETKTLTVGTGVVESTTAEVSWRKSAKAPRKMGGSEWKYLMDNGTPDQVARLKDDTGLQPDTPVLTVQTSADGTRGFSIALEQLARHKAMWLPEQDAFVTLADTPVDFAAHLASLKGERVLDRVHRGPEATLAEYRKVWEDFGAKAPVNIAARHGSFYKFGVNGSGEARPCNAAPHPFNQSVVWPSNCKVAEQRIVDGLPIASATMATKEQNIEVEQFAAPLENYDEDAAKKRESVSVLFTRIRSDGPVSFNVRLKAPKETTAQKPSEPSIRDGKEYTLDVRDVAGRFCVVDKETGSVWLMLEGKECSFNLKNSNPVDGESEVEIACSGKGEIVLKLTAPPVTADAAPLLAALDASKARAATVAYWEGWLARGARFEAPEREVNDLFRASLWSALVLPRYREGKMDLPYSNFAYGQFGTPWPSLQGLYVDHMIFGLLGHFAVAEQEFSVIYQNNQQPDGHLAGFANWGSYTPSMLYAIGQNYLLSRDRAEFERLLPATLKALGWCLENVSKNQSNKSAPGIPCLKLNDGTKNNSAWTVNSAFFYGALDVFGRALEGHGHPRAGEVKAAAVKFRADLERVGARSGVKSPVVQLADGTWINFVSTDSLVHRRLFEAWYPTSVDTGPMHMPWLNAIDPRGWLATAMIHDHEDNLYLKQWGSMNEPVYNHAHGITYLRRDDPEAAIRTFYSMMACAFSHRTLVSLEHRWGHRVFYCPPSTHGAWFSLYRNMLINEFGEGLTIGQAAPRAWLADGRKISVANAPTWFGPVSFEIDSAAARGAITARVNFAGELRPAQLVVRLRHPDKKPLRTVTVNGKEWKDFDSTKEWVIIPKPAEKAYTIVAGYAN